MESHCSSTEEIDVDSNTEEIDLKDTFSEKIDIKDDESVSSESSDTCELELKSSSRECPRDGTSQAGESDVETQCTGIIRFSSPLPMHRWVQRVDVSDSDTYSLPCPARPSSPWGRFDPYDSQEDQKQEYVGFATLPNQMHRKSLKRGFEFTLMVVGESGLGKSTLVNCLFLTDLYKDRTICDVEDRINQTVAITKKTVNIVEKGVKLKLNIVDTPGFADAIDTTNSWKPVVDYIDWQFEEYLRGEISVNRKNIPDNRVHCCLYFISPYGHGLKPIDVEFMKALHEKVNIVPVLAKADCLTHSEIQHMKNRILNEIDDHRIKIFQFPECDSDEDELFRKQDFELKKRIPFAVIGSNTTVESNGRRFRARLYPWGTVEVENPAYCDFVHLRAMLVRTHMQDLKDMTQDTLYERYRNQSLYRKTKRFSLECDN